MGRPSWRKRVIAGAAIVTTTAAAILTAAAPASAASLPCSYGSATSIKCPAITWTYQGHDNPWMMFLDHTPAGFPVNSVVHEWNMVTGIDSAYRWYTDGGLRNAHNIHVYTSSLGSGEGGRFTYNDGGGYFNEGAEILINKQLDSATKRRAAICHEIGHALGLGHSSSTSSCMYGDFLGDSHATTYNDDDRILLGRLYP